MKYLFDVMENEDHGEKGLRLQSLTSCDPHGPLTATHDLFEHFHEELDTDREALALGAMLYTRGEGNYFMFQVGMTVSSDFAHLLEWADTWGELTDPGVTRPLKDHVEAWITSGLVEAMNELKEQELDIPTMWPHWVRGWVRKGYREAKQRYSLPPVLISESFRRVRKDIEECFKHADIGSILEVHFVRKTLEHRVRLIEIWDEDHPDYEEIDWDEE